MRKADLDRLGATVADRLNALTDPQAIARFRDLFDLSLPCDAGAALSLCRRLCPGGGSYVPWLAGQLARLTPDAARFATLARQLDMFHHHKASLPEGERNLYGRDAAWLAERTETLVLRRAQRRLDQLPPAERRAVAAETTTLYSGAEGLIVLPHSKESWRFWSLGTKWCIGARDREFNCFEHHYGMAQPPVLLMPAGGGKYAIELGNTFTSERDKDLAALPPAAEALRRAGIARCALLRDYAGRTLITRAMPRVNPTHADMMAVMRLPADQRDEPAVMRPLLERYGLGLQFAGRRVRADDRCVNAAVRADSRALTHAAPEVLRRAPWLARDAVADCGGLYHNLPDDLKRRPDIIAAVFWSDAHGNDDTFDPTNTNAAWVDRALLTTTRMQLRVIDTLPGDALKRVQHLLPAAWGCAERLLDRGALRRALLGMTAAEAPRPATRAASLVPA